MIDFRHLRDTYTLYLRNILAKDEMSATDYDRFMALAYAVRSEFVSHWISTQREHIGSRRVYVLSMEYTLGKSLYNNMVNLGIEEAFTEAVNSLGISFRGLFEKDDDFDLGNSGKARSAACILESIATLGLPSMGYGMRYDFGQFRQEIKNGSQVEFPNDWLHKGHPWEIVRPEYACVVKFSGDIARVDNGKPLGPYEWKNAEEVYAVPYDVPIVGYRNDAVNTLRLWSARASEEFLPDYQNHNDYVRACEEKSQSGRITKVLFPDEDVRRAHDLRIRQQYFFVSAVIQDIIRRHKHNCGSIEGLDAKVAIHLNGSRCALAIPEMMRLLVDHEGIEWKRAWGMTQSIFSYSSSAVHREHIETWPVYKIGQLLPRVMQVIFDINAEHLDYLRSHSGHDVDLMRNISLIEEGEVKRIRFADMAVLGSSSVSGISAQHTEIITKHVFPIYYRQYPEKFNCKTSGVSHRRWLHCANRPLSALITRAIGDGWVRRSEELSKLEHYAKSAETLKAFANVKSRAKSELCASLREMFGVAFDATMLFDVHSRPIHMSKRQTLHILYILHNYLKIKSGEKSMCRRAHIFAGKASPSDFLAKQIIHLVNIVSDIVNGDPEAREYMRVAFIPNFGVGWAERLVTAADLSEQISTAPFEPCGTFNMKFAFNGVLTVASRGGSNIELIKRIGEENIFAFGKTAEELLSMNGGYNPAKILAESESLRAIFALLDSHLSKIPDGHTVYPLLSSLRDADRNFVLLDFADYINKQEAVDALFKNKGAWDSKCLLNISRMGWFSTDRLVRDFAASVWKII
ncbi:MAG: glycogen/starch/alpha-glucan family phosphorylase [Chitinispirillales bacterium]|jgi:starch phosphorylase|nr:glycogen/starch/alpha-glucan family phosphorylase [Chitinispirillales bacterium]